MTTLDAIAGLADRSRLEFIVCGGYAVNAYQVIRKTGDIDLVVRETDAKIWKEGLQALGYALFHESGAFLQFRADAPSSWPIDLILVDTATFESMRAEAKSFRFGAVQCRIPSVEHLIAMKLHALRSAPDTRMRQDALDVIELAERAGIDLGGESFRLLCERYADRTIRERILSYAGRSTH